jgi:hypothetical protein
VRYELRPKKQVNIGCGMCKARAEAEETGDIDCVICDVRAGAEGRDKYRLCST